MKRLLVISAAVAVNVCLGGIYAWSVFVPSLVEGYGYSTAQTQVVFGTVVFLLTCTMLFTGRLESRLGPRRMVMISAGLVFLGYVTAGFSGGNFAVLWIGYGVFTGVAVGFGYVTGLAVSMRWFPERRGLAAGLVVGGYGAGAILLSVMGQGLLNRGWEVMGVFRLLGAVFAVVMLLCSAAVCNPAGYHGKELSATVRRRDVLGTVRFAVLAIATGLGTFPGLMIIGNLKPIALSFGFSGFMGVLAISVISVGNASGRIVGGYAHDVLKWVTITVVLGVVSVSAGVLAFGGEVGAAVFLGTVLLVGAGYGAMLSNIPAQVTDEYGHENFGTVYPMVLMVHGITALFAAPLGGYFFDRYASYRGAILIAAAVGFGCLAVYGFAYARYYKLVRR